ncbi:non-ribosomal peptide synthetase [Thermoflavimicrobium dichotomicum]|uniref:Non-ribosomal peptide synthase domain TIGR01720/amino acid adenylation domain-containing protein n=1 Tax=Thermoflavimicrobium dichotomicum TaxID=46223 RepID=A0A1I3T0L7_9BACL|nr:non-ribosomal peptide synthetase [Thermoflavimicrobium dichotomicum]SFJ64648.1 non-ribosomal peptide synthase domain TIGR01720/amino acid adenylation domain-containing protein [Thermoflavimicrobium dichotomicum]
MNLHNPLLSVPVEELSYWRHVLRGASALQLPTDYPRSLNEPFEQAKIEVELPQRWMGKLEGFSREMGVPFSVTVFSLFKILLLRYSGQKDMVVGGALDGGAYPVLFRMKGIENPRFYDWIKQVRQKVDKSLQHVTGSFKSIVKELGLETEKGLSLFAVQFAWLTDQKDDHGGSPSFELKLGILQHENQWIARFTYDSKLFNQDKIQRMAQHFLRLLEESVMRPEGTIRTYSILTSEEEQLIRSWNQTEKSYPQDRYVYQWIEQQAEKISNRLAVVSQNGQLTYGELNRNANQLAHYLQKRGVRSGDFVAICLERSCDLVVGLLGILKAGGAYVPIDPTYPKERIAYMLQDSCVSLIITKSHLIDKLEGGSKRLICLDLDEEEIARESEGSIQANDTLDDLAYMIYTSGSTGQPKGVMISHRSILNLIFWHLRTYQVTSEDRMTLLAGTAFDASVWEIWPALTAGASLYIPDEEVRMSPLALKEWLIENQITISFLPTPLLESVLWLDWPKQVTLRKLLTGGDQLRFYPPHDFPIDVVNHYGPTENTVVTTMFEVPKGIRRKTVPAIGRPIANTEVYVLDAYLQPVPIGVPGELYVGGAGLAQGYFQREVLTKQRFIPHPFHSDPGAKLYRTGDLVRYLEDGNLEFLGRLDHQVKIRGYRIELGEIEAVLNQHPKVRESLVMAHEDESGEKRLVAYLVISGEKLDDWRSYLKGKLPEYMVPTVYVVLDSFPLTPNGKIDRHALPVPEMDTEAYLTPQTETEKQVAEIWGKVLKLEKVGLNDDFFALGGHSLLAGQIVSRINQMFGLDLSVSILFEKTTVRELVEWIDRSQTEHHHRLLRLERTDSSKKMIPMSYAQQRLWFLHRLNPQLAAYHIPFLLRLKGTLHCDALKWSMEQLVQRHEALRTRFTEIDGQAVQILTDEIKISWTVKDLRQTTDPEKEAMSFVHREAAEPFDLQRGPLLRVHLLRVADGEWLLLLHMHHIISDGWSMEILVRELFQFYAAYIEGRTTLDLSEIPVRYADYSEWQKVWLQKDAMKQQLVYWKQKLKNVPVLELPTDRPRLSEQTFKGTTYQQIIPDELVTALRKLSRQEGTTLFMTLLAAFKVLLSRYTGQSDIAVGSPVAGRNHPEVENVVGFFVNSLVFRTDLSGNPSFREFLHRVRNVAVEAYANQDIPFEQVVHELQPERSLSYSPLFQVMFGLQDLPEVLETVPGLQVETIGMEHKTSKFDLTLMMYQKRDQLLAAFEYNTDLFDESTIRRMADNFVTLLWGIVSTPTQVISKLPLLSEQERRQLDQWNETALDIRPVCIHQLFEQQAQQTPNQVALLTDTESLTYRELNERANQLAHYLRSMEVGPEVLVGICMERSTDLIVGLLGILKAGGAYVPLDPAYPKERIAYMLEDSRVKVLLTQEKLLSELPDTSAMVVCLDRDQQLIREKSIKNTESEVQPEHLAYVIYTSGSTGNPKGVMIEHRSTVTLIQWAYHVFLPDELKGVLAATSVCFDLSVFEIFVPLGCGGMVILADNALELPYLAARHQVTLVNTVPSAAKELLKIGGFPSSVKVVNLAGEPLPQTLVRQLYQLGTVEKVYNLYGPSEDTTYSTFALIEKDDPRSPSIGCPIANTEAYVLDAHLERVPIGVPGELYLGGFGLSRGYLNKPELTQERFIPHPFRDHSEARLYKTGDLVRYRTDGQLEFLGRTDYQVKVRGFRIELGEIEARLRQHPYVSEVVVVAREDVPGEKRLVAYLVLKEQQQANMEKWRSYLKQKLPDYMIPSAFVVLDAMPLTPNGKIDRKQLPRPEQQHLELSSRFQAPQTELEQALAEIWCKVLGMKQVGIYDSFFELGGDSILTLQVIAEASKQGLYLTPKHFFEYPTIFQLAKVAGDTSSIEAEQGIVTGELPLTPIQHWFFELEIPNRHNWNQSVVLKLRPGIDASLLEQAIQQVVEHHDALRLRFKEQENLWHQWNAAEERMNLFQKINKADVPASERERWLQKELDHAESRLNIERGPLLQTVWVDFGETCYLVMVIHHLAVDGVSWRIILEDIQTVYEQLRTGQEVILPRKTTSYKEWAFRLQQYARSKSLLAEHSFWVHQLTDAVYRIPVDDARASAREKKVNQLVRSLNMEETNLLLKEAPNRFRAKLPEILLTALVETFAEWTKRRSLLVHLEGHGRENVIEGVDITRTVGWFTSIYPVFLQLKQAKTLSESLAEVKEQLRQVPHNGFGYGILRYLAEEETVRQMKQIPQAEVSFNYLGQFDQLLMESPCFSKWVQFNGPSEKQASVRPHLIDIAAMVTEGCLRVMWIYDEAYHQPETIERLAQHYLKWLRAMLHDQTTARFTPSDFSKAKLSKTELNKVLAKLTKKKR